MNTLEKLYSVFAVVFALGLTFGLIFLPTLRQPNLLLPLCLLGMAVNIGLLFVVLRDIFQRQFAPTHHRLIWLAVVLVFWPSIPYYLACYGFRKRL